MTFDPSAFAEEMRAARARKRWTIDDLARAAGLGRMTIVRYERGEATKSGIIDKIRHAIGASESAQASPQKHEAEPVGTAFAKIGLALRNARELAGKSQDVVATASCVSRVTLAKYESGDIAKLDELLRIATVVGLSIDVSAMLGVPAPPRQVQAHSFFCSHCGLKNIVETK